MRRAEDLAVPALKTHAGHCLLHNWQDVLIGRGYNRRWADYVTDLAPGAEILINEYGCHQILSFVVAFCGCIRFFPVLHTSPANFPSVQ